MTWPLVALAVVCVVGGVAVLDPAFLDADAEPLHWPVAAIGLGLAVVAALLTWAEWVRLGRHDPARTLGRLRPALNRELGWDELIGQAVVRPVREAVTGTRLAETEVVETYVRGGDGAAQWTGRLIRAWHDGNLQRYVTAVAVGALALGVALGVTR